MSEDNTTKDSFSNHYAEYRACRNIMGCPNEAELTTTQKALDEAVKETAAEKYFHSETRKEFDTILTHLADIREVVLRSPEYDKHLCEMVSDPESCAIYCLEWAKGMESKLDEAMKALDDADDIIGIPDYYWSGEEQKKLERFNIAYKKIRGEA